MTVETNNIHALRTALERLDFFSGVADDVALKDRHRDQIDARVIHIRRLLEDELRKAERDLIRSYPIS
jgi:hypothetical protein